MDLVTFHNIEYWFKSNVVVDLTIIKTSIDEISYSDKEIEATVKNFFYIAFLKL
jgi:hypothetical protein